MKEDNRLKIRNQIWLDADMFYSDAFNCLSASAIKTLMRCLQKRKWDNIKLRGKSRKQNVYGNEGFIFPYAEAADLKIAGDTQHWKNMKKLVEVGFLEVVHQGGWYQKHERKKDYNVYKYSDRWGKYGSSEFVTVEKPKVLPEQFHIRANMERKKLKVTSQKRSGQLHKSEDERPKQSIIRLHKNEVEPKVIKNRQTLMDIAQADLFQSNLAFTSPSSRN
jgi:hypothetical protein